jgi:hypothetical protein
MTTVSGLFNSHEAASAAVRELESLGIASHDISMVGPDRKDQAAGEPRSFGAKGDHVAADAGQGAEIGGAVGAVGGLLAGLGMLAIPGIGPVVAAGWLVSTLTGAVAGAVVGGAAGGLIGALTEAGVPEEHAHVYAEGVRRGGTLVIARVGPEQEATAHSVLDRTGRADLDTRARTYREEGWSRFDPEGQPYAVDDLDRPGLTSSPRI